MNFLLFGYGSIGHRHAGILRDMGHEVTTIDPDPVTGADYQSIDYLSPNRTIDGHAAEIKNIISQFDAVLDCTPPDVRAGWTVPARARFIEKPLGENTHPTCPVTEPTMMGFCYRYAPYLVDFINSFQGERIYSVSIVGGQWLPDWHPGEDYRERDHGTPGRGGVVLDSLPHSLYVARWMLGDLDLVGAVKGHLSELELETEDVAAVLLRSRGVGVPCYLLADYLRQPRRFYITVVHSGGTSQWEFAPKEADQMYRRQMQVFCDMCAGKRHLDEYPTLRDGIAVQWLLDQVLLTRAERESLKRYRTG